MNDYTSRLTESLEKLVSECKVYLPNANGLNDAIELIEEVKEDQKHIEFTRCQKLDSNGNPRYMCHFLSLVTSEEMESFHAFYGLNAISQAYMWACKRANKIGGRKYHNKSYGGGIVFQSYSTVELENDIKRVIANDKKFTA